MQRSRLRALTRLCLSLALLSGVPISAQPPHPAADSPYAKARRLLTAGNVDAAEPELWQALKANQNDAEALLLLGEVRLRQQRFAEAESLFLGITSFAAGHSAVTPDIAAETHAGLAQARMAQGKGADAITEWAFAVQLDPANPGYSVALAALYREQGRCTEALATLVALSAHSPKAQLPVSAIPIQAACLLASGKSDEAKKLVTLVQAAPNQVSALDLAQVFLDAHQPVLAEAALAGTLRRAHTPGRGWFLAGLAAEQQNHLAVALRDYRRAAALSPDDAEVLASLGGLLLRQGDTAQAMLLLERAATLAPDSVAVLRQTVAAALRTQRADLARKSASRLYQLSPDNADDVYLAGAAFLSVGSFQAAIKVFTHYLETKPDDARAELALGTAYRETRNFGNAETHLSRSVALDGVQTEAVYQLAEVYLAQNKPDAARVLLQKNAVAPEPHAPSLIALGKLDLESGDNASAAVLLERAAALVPKNPEVHYQLSLVYKRLGKDSASQEQAQVSKRLRTEQHREQNSTADDVHPPM